METPRATDGMGSGVVAPDLLEFEVLNLPQSFLQLLFLLIELPRAVTRLELAHHVAAKKPKPHLIALHHVGQVGMLRKIALWSLTRCDAHQVAW